MLIYIIAFLTGAVLPLITSARIWKSELKLGFHLFIISTVLYLQILGEMMLKVTDLESYIKYFSAFIIGFRIVHLAYISQLAFKLKKKSKSIGSLLSFTLISNIFLWPIVFLRLLSQF